jgi:hypothetical protein
VRGCPEPSLDIRCVIWKNEEFRLVAFILIGVVKIPGDLYEADVSTQQLETKTYAWIPGAHGNEGREGRFEK